MGNNLSKFKLTTQQLVDKEYEYCINEMGASRHGGVGVEGGSLSYHIRTSLTSHPSLGKVNVKIHKEKLEKLMRQQGKISD